MLLEVAAAGTVLFFLADELLHLAVEGVGEPPVAGEQYVALHGAEMNPSIRIVDGIEKLAGWLAANPQ